MSIFQGLRTWLIRLLGGTTSESQTHSQAIEQDPSERASTAPVVQQDAGDSIATPKPFDATESSENAEIDQQASVEQVDHADQPEAEDVRTAKQSAPSERTLARAEDLAPYDEHLLERAKMQWHLGDWESLLRIEREALQSHPDRAKLCILYASALLQNGQTDIATRYVQLAREFGCNKKFIAQVLIAGVHNSLARAATLVGDEAKAQSHFRLAVSADASGVDSSVVAEVRARRETQLLTQALAQQAATTVHLAEQAGENLSESDVAANEGDAEGKKSNAALQC